MEKEVEEVEEKEGTAAISTTSQKVTSTMTDLQRGPIASQLTDETMTSSTGALLEDSKEEYEEVKTTLRAPSPRFVTPPLLPESPEPQDKGNETRVVMTPLPNEPGDVDSNATTDRKADVADPVLLYTPVITTTGFGDVTPELVPVTSEGDAVSSTLSSGVKDHAHTPGIEAGKMTTQDRKRRILAAEVKEVGAVGKPNVMPGERGICS